MSTEAYVALSVAEAVLLVLVLAIALIWIRQSLDEITKRLATLASALGGIERDLQLIGVAVPPINDPLTAIAGALPNIARKAEMVARRVRSRADPLRRGPRRAPVTVGAAGAAELVASVDPLTAPARDRPEPSRIRDERESPVATQEAETIRRGNRHAP